MNYYPHHIGDFNSATRHLSRIERSIYRDMIEMYYDTEQPLLLDRAALCRKLMARSDEESTAVEQVLNEFFTETEQGWTNGRCDKEIEAYHKKLNGKSAAGKASAAARAANKAPLEPAPDKEGSTGLQQPLKSCSTNQEPRTKNQNQEPKETTTPPAAEYSPEFEIAWSGYPERPGANKKNAYKAWNARLKAGVDFTQMTLGVDRYAHYCSAMKVEPQFIKQPETFFGPSEHYLSDWKPVAASVGSKSQVEDLDAINARNNAEAKRLLFGTPSEVRTINA